jgi:predicted hotdog family 3-hydroxylacyl-ACP dehydratase
MLPWFSGEIEMSLPDIRSLVPHAGPMVLLDRVLAVDADSLCAEVTIRPDSLFCGVNGVGAWVGIEYMAQAIAAHSGYAALQRGEPVKIGFLLGARRYACTWQAFPVGAVLRVQIRCLLFADNGLASFECRIDEEDETVASAAVSVFLPANVDEFLNRSVT